MGDRYTASPWRRHAPLSSSRALVRQKRAQAMPHVYLGRQRQPIRDIYLNEHPGERSHGRFRWLISTCLAGAVGVLAIAVVISGSLERDKTRSGFLDPLTEGLQKGAMQPFQFPQRIVAGLNWAIPKTHRLQINAGVMSTKYIIRETMRQRLGDREVVLMKPYARLYSRLANVPSEDAAAIPAFNPLALYSASATAAGDDDRTSSNQAQVSVRVVELLGGVLPAEDGEELDAKDAAYLVTRLMQENRGELFNASHNSFQSQSGQSQSGQSQSDGNSLDGNPLGLGGPFDLLAIPDAALTLGAAQPNTTQLIKNIFEAEPESDLRANEVKAVAVRRGDSLVKLLLSAGTEPWQAGQMANAAVRIFPAKALTPGQTIYFTLVSSLTQPDKSELARFSIFAPGGLHKVTVTRNAAGDFAATTTPVDNAGLQAALQGYGTQRQTSLYESLFRSTRQQGLADDVILANFRIHAYDADFRKPVRAGDAADFFFDLVDEDKGSDSPLGQMLYTSLTQAGRKRGFYRFRTSDSRVDYYDQNGNNSKKFLTRKPVRSGQVRLTSGYGMRLHPLLRIRKMHSGVDWAAPRGTPILAAGIGTVEFAGRKGANGKYIRVKHANGYKTTYSHLHRIARGVRPGKKVRQGQVIGSVGSTGLSSGSHLHFAVLVNNRPIDPMKMRVPRQRRLTGKDLADFKRERARIDDLMRRSPVTRLGQ